MVGVGLRMLFGDPVKLIGLVLGVAFSTLLMTQQGGFFVSLVSLSGNIVSDARDVSVWVMDPRTETAEDPTAMRDIEVQRVRGTPGVAEAAPLLRAPATLRAPDTGLTTAAAIVGLDDARPLGLPARFVAGGPDDLRRPDAIAIDQLGFSRLWPGEPIAPGKTLEINERRAVIVAITDAQPGFGAPTVVHTRLSQALAYAPGGRNRLSFVVARIEPGESPEAVARRIEAATGLRALTSAEFLRASVDYVLSSTGIAFSFGVVIALGGVVGVLVAGLTFTLFVNENLKQFAVLKAMGVSNLRLLAMVAAQGLTVASLGYAFGLWGAVSFFEAVDQPLSDLKGFWLPWQVAALSFAAILGIVMLAALVALRRVLTLDPAVVFRG